jgi:hypothetical protein
MLYYYLEVIKMETKVTNGTRIKDLKSLLAVKFDGSEVWVNQHGPATRPIRPEDVLDRIVIEIADYLKKEGEAAKTQQNYKMLMEAKGVLADYNVKKLDAYHTLVLNINKNFEDVLLPELLERLGDMAQLRQYYLTQIGKNLD